ncbi:MAG TPA: 5'-nucleotidase C-terminal domain-containing protein [Bryobacteraceae bacterium]|nr:5'-nucleotidase C-terminal domain-containing protein [Bryobacteraceae bacterium]
MSLHRVILLFAGVLLAQAESVRITVLVTTDLHGNIFPYDYFTAKPMERGLAKISTLIRQERERNPNNLLLDCGDTIQGAPLEGVHQEYIRTGVLPRGLKLESKPPLADPMMLAMNHIGYDAMAVGNHEYNFGLKNFERARKEARFPWISANTTVASGAMKPLAPYLLKTIAGVKIAVVGLTTPAVPGWEKPEHIRGLRFLNAAEAARSAVAEVRAKHKPDLVLIAAHAGLNRDPKTGKVHAGETGFENPVYQIAREVPGIDAIVFGHSHQQLEDYRVNGVLLLQPKNWGISLGRVEFEMERRDGGWKVVSKTGKLLPVTRNVEADPEILSIGKPYHDMTEQYLNMPVAESPANLDAILARVQDTALVDAIQQVQLHYSKADVSLTAMFNPRVRFPKGPVSVREVAALYIYDNELYLVEGNGKMLREALENAARYYRSCRDAACGEGALINRNVMGFNFDIAQGVDYEIDLTRPEGQRIRNLRFKGKPLEDSRPLKIAVNNYRAAGSAGYTMFRDAKVLWKSGEEIRDLIIRYYTGQKRLPAKPDGNWRIVPEAASRRLSADAQADAVRTANF